MSATRGPPLRPGLPVEAGEGGGPGPALAGHHAPIGVEGRAVRVERQGPRKVRVGQAEALRPKEDHAQPVPRLARDLRHPTHTTHPRPCLVVHAVLQKRAAEHRSSLLHVIDGHVLVPTQRVRIS